MIELVNIEGQKYPDWQRCNSTTELGFTVTSVGTDWSVLHEKGRVTVGAEWCRPLDAAPFLMNKGAVYGPLAVGAA